MTIKYGATKKEQFKELFFFRRRYFVTYGGVAKNYIMYWGLRLLVYHMN